MAAIDSPRISFSHDLHHTDITPIEHNPNRPDSSLLNPNPEFDFCISDTINGNQTSSADELFSNGLILPLQLQKKFINPQPLPIPSTNENSKDNIILNEQKKQHQSKSFWRIKRSSSLHCDNTCKKSSFWSLPLLSRSNSTGSVPPSSKKDNQKQNSQKQQKNSMAVPPSSGFYTYPSSQKPPIKKNYGGGAYGSNGVRISPVLNVPPPFISKGTANLFGLGSFFRNGKDKKNKK